MSGCCETLHFKGRDESSVKPSFVATGLCVEILVELEMVTASQEQHYKRETLYKEAHRETLAAAGLYISLRKCGHMLSGQTDSDRSGALVVKRLVS